MKKLIILMLLVSFLKAQDRLDPDAKLKYTVSPYSTAPTTIYDTTRNEFIYGWNWGSESKKLDEALGINFIHESNDYHPANTNWSDPNGIWGDIFMGENSRLTWSTRSIAHGDITEGHIQAPAIHFEPYFPVDSSDLFLGWVGDSVGSVFGFKFRHPEFVQIQDPENNFHHFIMSESGMPPGVDQVVALEGLWPNDEFIALTRDGENTQFPRQNEYNGTEWYLTMRLKPLEVIDSTNYQDTVLIITMPYKAMDIEEISENNYDTTNANGLIKFSEVPTTNIADVQDINYSFTYTGGTNNYNLGKTRGTTNYSQPTGDTLFITGEMIRTSLANNLNTFITISAFFECKNGVVGVNPSLWTNEHKNLRESEDGLRIYELDLKIDYRKGIDIALDWVRIETPKFQQLIRGEFDQEIVDDFKDDLERMNTVRPDLTIFRYFGIDEFWLEHSQANRYLNKLFDGIATSEGNAYHMPGRYLYHTDFKEYWTGDTQSRNPSPTPLLKKVHRFTSPSLNQKFDDLFRAGFVAGYYGKEYWDTNRTFSNIIKRDTLGSTYETFIKRHCHSCTFYTESFWQDTANINSYEDLWVLAQDEDIYELPWHLNPISYTNYNGKLWHVGYILHNYYYKRPSQIFGSKPLLANIWLGFEFKARDSLNSDYILLNRPTKTKEEFIQETYSNIILGAKGLYFWYGKSSGGNTEEEPNKYGGFTAFSRLGSNASDIDFHDTLSVGYDVVMNNSLGSDYIENNDIFLLANRDNSGTIPDYTIDNFINENVIEEDSTGLDTDRFYVGSKTYRKEAWKLNKWIEHNEDEIMDLRLVAWYGKGYKELYRQHPDFDFQNDTILDNFIDFKNVKTEKIYQPNVDGTFVPDVPESRDSSFFDITLLFNSDTLDQQGSTTFYIGVQNRRTDPLIFVEDTPPHSSDRGLQFFSGAEFDDFVQNGGDDLFGNTRDTSYWQDQWWKRLGSRRIEIPFNRGTNPNGRYLEVKELGADGLESVGWWYGDKYYDLVSDSIRYDGTLSIDLLPGEARILKVVSKYISSLDRSNCDICKEWEDGGFRVESSKIIDEFNNCCYDLKLIRDNPTPIQISCTQLPVPFRLVVDNEQNILQISLVN